MEQDHIRTDHRSTALESLEVGLQIVQQRDLDHLQSNFHGWIFVPRNFEENHMAEGIYFGGNFQSLRCHVQ